MVEQTALNRMVAGSIPATPTYIAWEYSSVGRAASS